LLRLLLRLKRFADSLAGEEFVMRAAAAEAAFHSEALMARLNVVPFPFVKESEIFRRL